LADEVLAIQSALRGAAPQTAISRLDALLSSE
jgi:hypothetical protein